MSVCVDSCVCGMLPQVCGAVGKEFISQLTSDGLPVWATHTLDELLVVMQDSVLPDVSRLHLGAEVSMHTYLYVFMCVCLYVCVLNE